MTVQFPFKQTIALATLAVFALVLTLACSSTVDDPAADSPTIPRLRKPRIRQSPTRLRRQPRIELADAVVRHSDKHHGRGTDQGGNSGRLDHRGPHRRRRLRYS
ncbi:hypothetical protein [Phytoactinopolyspora mesophila]|uniref:hypothetical protein n=1 Tax=Phytoactinopolyspora mesophila TaxID=2650750 RepID=UPI001FEC453F|nr:hypothetical protein [Phytoactinopolyspora mesophila]